MLKYLDQFLNKITMYKLALYSLMAVSLIAVGMGFSGYLPYSGTDLLIGFLVYPAACYIWNYALAYLLKAPATADSAPITGYILFLIMAPVGLGQLWLPWLISLVAMASKYVLAWKKKHVFNPAAVAAVVMGFTPFAAIWWVASPKLFWLVLIMGFLLVRKTRRFSIVFASWLGFFITYFLAFRPEDPLNAVAQAFLSWPILFFSTVMLTEPSTLPPKQWQRLTEGFVIGLFLGNPLHVFGNLFTTPELMLCLGNIYSFFMGLKMKAKMALVEAKQLASDAVEFAFRPDRKLSFEAGQYLEWSLPHDPQDQRGIRRYFTVSSAPQDELVKVGVRFSEKSSTFKKYLKNLKQGDWLYAGNTTGDFTLPAKQQKLGFVAGGIGITPFMSMIREAVMQNRKLDAVLFYANKSDDVPYRAELDEAQQKIGLKVVYVIDGMITPELLHQHAADTKGRRWYLSGPNAMVDAYKALIKKEGVSPFRIRTDYFPGY